MSENSSGKASRCKWTSAEVETFLEIIHQLKLQAALRRARSNAKVFRMVSREMSRRNCPKSPKHLRVKFHQMRRQYARARNGGEPFEHFEAVHELMQGEDVSDLDEEALESNSDMEADEDQSGMISETEGDGRCHQAGKYGNTNLGDFPSQMLWMSQDLQLTSSPAASGQRAKWTFS